MEASVSPSSEKLAKGATLFGLVLLAILLWPAFVQLPGENRSRWDDTVAVGAQLAGAIADYVHLHGSLPEGGNRAIVAALRGANPAGGMPLEFPPEALNEHGELLDPWGTPYRLGYDFKTQQPKVHSAGPNRVFESDHAKRSDDYRSWRVHQGARP